MAISWDVQINVLDVAAQAVSVTATRTDDADPTNPKTYSVAYAVITTSAQKLAVMDNIWSQHQAAVTKESAIGAFIGSLQADAKTNLEARE